MTEEQGNKNYEIELILLDAEWIIEKVYSNHMITNNYAASMLCVI